MTKKRLTIAQFKSGCAQHDGYFEHPAALLCKNTPGGIVPDMSPEGRITATAIISNKSVDRDGDTIALEGWDLEPYRKSGSVLWGHDADRPVGRPLATWIEGDNLMSRMEFMPRDMGEGDAAGFGYMVGRWVQEGFVRGTSVGFLPRDAEPAENLEGRESAFMPLDFKAQELLEWSYTPIPSNPTALVQASKAKGIDLAPLKSWASKALDEGAGIYSKDYLERVWADFKSISVSIQNPQKNEAEQAEPEQAEQAEEKTVMAEMKKTADIVRAAKEAAHAAIKESVKDIKDALETAAELGLEIDDETKSELLEVVAPLQPAEEKEAEEVEEAKDEAVEETKEPETFDEKLEEEAKRLGVDPKELVEKIAADIVARHRGRVD